MQTVETVHASSRSHAQPSPRFPKSMHVLEDSEYGLGTKPSLAPDDLDFLGIDHVRVEMKFYSDDPVDPLEL